MSINPVIFSQVRGGYGRPGPKSYTITFKQDPKGHVLYNGSGFYSYIIKSLVRGHLVHRRRKMILSTGAIACAFQIRKVLAYSISLLPRYSEQKGITPLVLDNRSEIHLLFCMGAMPPNLQRNGGKCPHCPHGSSAYVV